MTDTFDNTTDLWGEMAKNAPEEAPVFEELPADAWILAKTSNTGGASPTVRSFDLKDGSGKFFSFNVGINCVGGDKKINAKSHKNRMVFYKAGVHAGDRETHGGPISGRFVTFLNAIFGPGVGDDLLPTKGDDADTKKEKSAKRTRLRWAKTTACLKEIAGTDPEIDGAAVVREAYDDLGQYIAGLVTVYLKENPATLLFKTKFGKTYEGVKPIEIGGVEDPTARNLANRKVEAFPTDDEDTTSTF